MKNTIVINTIACAFALAIGLTSCEEKKSKAEIDNKGVDIEGKKGGELEIDKRGLEIEGSKGGKVEVSKGDVDVRVGKKDVDIEIKK